VERSPFARANTPGRHRPRASAKTPGRDEEERRPGRRATARPLFQPRSGAPKSTGSSGIDGEGRARGGPGQGQASVGSGLAFDGGSAIQTRSRKGGKGKQNQGAKCSLIGFSEGLERGHPPREVPGCGIILASKRGTWALALGRMVSCGGRAALPTAKQKGSTSALVQATGYGKRVTQVSGCVGKLGEVFGPTFG